jgi:outer membrane autotransporter protein
VSTNALAHTVVLTDGTLSGNITLGDGVDTLSISGLTSNVYSGNASLGAGADELYINHSATVSGTIDGGSDAGDVATIGNAGTVADITGNVTGFESISANDDAIINVNGGSIEAGSVIHLNGTSALNINKGGSYSGNVDGDPTATLAFGADGTGGSFVTGGVIDNVSLAFTSGDTTVSGAVGGGAAVDDMTIGADATVVFNDDVLSAGALSNGGALTVAAGKTLTAASATGAGSYTIGVTSDGTTNTAGALDFTGTADFTGATISAAVSGGSPLVLGTTDHVITAATVTGLPTEVTDTSYLYDFAFDTTTNGANDVGLTVTQGHSLEEASDTDNNRKAANVLLFDNATSTDPQLNAVQASIQSASSQKEYNERVEATLPDLSGGEVVGAVTYTDLSLGVTNDRLAMLRTGTESGIATGNVSQGLRMWGQAFGASASQDQRDGIDGYDSTTWGGAVGFDTENAMSDRSVVGVAFSYGNSDVDSDNASDTQADIDSYQVTLYGMLDLNNAAYLNAQLAYAYNDIDTDRSNIGGVAGLDAQGSYHANVYSARAELGRDLQYDMTTITPHVMGNWTHFDPDSYTETGAGGANLSVDGDSLDIIEAGIGVDASWMFQNADGSYIQPKLTAGYRYNFGDDQVENSTSFVGGGPAFRTEGADPAANRFNVGGSIRYFSTDNWDLTASYNYDFRSDYGAHEGLLRAAYKF